MKLLDGVCWGLLPARGGSKSIPLKNIAAFGGRPLIDYNILAAQACHAISRLICSTDSPEIARRCLELDVEVHNRPAELAGDDIPVLEVVERFVEDTQAREGVMPELIALLQPTSPLLLPAHIDDCVAEMRTHPDAGSAQTVVPCPHNHHAYNQRVIDDEGIVTFRFVEERKRAYNKQRKPSHFLFGNLVVIRVEAALRQRMSFARPSRAVVIAWPYDLDADGPDDFRLGEAMLQSGLVRLPHIG